MHSASIERIAKHNDKDAENNLSAFSCCNDNSHSAEFNDGCWVSYDLYPPLVCGTDGQTYKDNGSFQCAQNGEYGKRVNLQVKHEGPCWPWQHHSDHIKYFFVIVSFQ